MKPFATKNIVIEFTESELNDIIFHLLDNCVYNRQNGYNTIADEEKDLAYKLSEIKDKLPF